MRSDNAKTPLTKATALGRAQGPEPPHLGSLQQLDDLGLGFVRPVLGGGPVGSLLLLLLLCRSGPREPGERCQQRQQAWAPAVRRDSGWRHLHLGPRASCQPREQARGAAPAPPPRGPEEASAQTPAEEPVHAPAAFSAHCRPGAILAPAPAASALWIGRALTTEQDILASARAMTRVDVTLSSPAPAGVGILRG